VRNLNDFLHENRKDLCSVGVLETNDFLRTNLIFCYIVSFSKIVSDFWTSRLLAASEILVPS